MPLTLKQTTKKIDPSLYPSNAHIKMNTPWQSPPNSSLCTPNPPFKLPILFKNYHRFSRKETFLACWTYYSVYLKKAKKSESSRNHCTHESVLNRTMQKQNCKTASKKPVCQLTDDIDRKKKNLSRPVLKHGPPTPMSNLFNLRAGNKLRLKAKINWLGWRINNYYHKNAQKNKNWRKETNIEMSPMPNIKHTLAILTNSLDTMYCQQRKNGESSKQSRNSMSPFSLGSAKYSWTQTPWQREKLLLRIFYHCNSLYFINSLP